MANNSDPALELAKLCEKLARIGRNVAGDTVLSEAFDVEPWSPQFFEIIFSITKRTQYLEEILHSLDIDENARNAALVHIAAIRSAFDKNSMNGSWINRGQKQLGQEHSSPVKMLSFAINKTFPIPILSEEEETEVLELVSELINWLEAEQISENDFIRQNLIDGLKGFLFRFEKLEWMGWGYSIESLKNVIEAYLVLEGRADPAKAPDAAALLKRVGPKIAKVWDIVGVGKEATDKADWALKAYGLVSIAYQTPSAIAGLLTGP